MLRDGVAQRLLESGLWLLRSHLLAMAPVRPTARAKTCNLP